jgi:hypothetical protein
VQRTLLIPLVMLFLAAGCASKVQVEDTAAETAPAAEAAPVAEARPAEAATGDVAPPPPMAIAGSGICRIYGLPEGFDAKGLRIGGAVQGEILGEAIGEPTDYVTALRACVDDATCVGVTSDWYVGAPFRAMRAADTFRPDEGSYACTTLVGGRP